MRKFAKKHLSTLIGVAIVATAGSSCFSGTWRTYAHYLKKW